MIIRTLNSSDAPQLIETFNRAFADYPIHVQLSESLLEEKVRTEHIVWELSLGAFQDGQMQGFVMHGLDEVDGIRTLYNGGTGVVPEARGQKLTQKMYADCLQILKRSGARQIILEVLEQNLAAQKAYSALGFQTQRKLLAFAGKPEVEEELSGYTLSQLDRAELPSLEHLLSYRPSYQHSLSAVLRSRAYECWQLKAEGGEACAYAVMNPQSGRVAQFACADSEAALTLLGLLARQTGKPLNFVNIEEKASLPDMLKGAGLKHTLSQLEMKLAL